ncbi:torso-like protein [Halyomorpha halys]|uniref:torso-like protein n=1 Tax=Halyomorpha halys TaxID=286706 RepID=UPI0006D4C85B|nr:torso-like protein [Halyomorpha halys]
MLYLLLFLFGESLAMDSLKIGNAMNIFGRYGFMGVSMKVVGRPQPWVFREPSVDVFEIMEDDIISYTDKDGAIFNGDFHMEFCDDVTQLLEAYFREFRIEHAKEPWKAFAASWSDEAIAKNFGLNTSYIAHDYCYVLVRLSRNKESKKLSDDAASNLKPLEHIKHSSDDVEYGNAASVGNFVKKFGSHYIMSYTTGDSLYQVIVYHPPVYHRLKKKLRKTGITSLRKVELQAFFSPWYADHVGQILSSSGNSTIAEWAKSALRSRSFMFPYSSLLKLYGNEKLLRELDKKLENGALLSLELKTLTPLFNDQTKKQWFVEVISNVIELWESNMRLSY